MFSCWVILSLFLTFSVVPKLGSYKKPSLVKISLRFVLPFSQREKPRKPKENASHPPSVSSNMHIEGRWEKEEGGGTTPWHVAWGVLLISRPSCQTRGSWGLPWHRFRGRENGGAVWNWEECSAWGSCVSPSQVFQALHRLFAPLISTLGLNSKAAEVVSILFMHYDSFQRYLTRVCLSTGRMSWATVHCNSMVLCYSSHLASFVSNTEDRWWKMKSSDRNFTI